MGRLQAFLTLYMEIMEKGTDSVHKILTHIRDHPDEPCLIHCTGLNTLLIHPRGIRRLNISQPERTEREQLLPSFKWYGNFE